MLQLLVAQASGGPEPAPSATKDTQAGRLVQEFLDIKGWSTREFAARIALAAKGRDELWLTTSRKTIERVIDHGHVPHSRCKAAIALGMGVPPWKIWGEGQMPLAHQREQIVREATG